MLYEFINARRDEIIATARLRVVTRSWPAIGPNELEHGVPLFLTQLAETLRLEGTAAPFLSGAIGVTGARHGAELLAGGFGVTQVVQDYGDICQSITEVAVRHGAPISVEEFHTLNRCLDTAIAEAVTEHTRLATEQRASENAEHLGHMAHELRDRLNTAMLAFDALRRGRVGISGSTGDVLGRSLTALQTLVGHTISEVRLARGAHRRQRLSLAVLIAEIGAAAFLHSEPRGIRFEVEPVDPSLFVTGDAQLLSSALMNLLQNAFKFTPQGGLVGMRAIAAGDRIGIVVEDECGGFPDTGSDPFQTFGERRGRDRTGLGLGLSIARKAARFHGGDITVKNRPGHGCGFTLDLPLAVDADQARAVAHADSSGAAS